MEDINIKFEELFHQMMTNQLDVLPKIDEFLTQFRIEPDQPYYGTLKFNYAFIQEKNNLHEEALIGYKELLGTKVDLATETNLLLGILRCLESLKRTDEIYEYQDRLRKLIPS